MMPAADGTELTASAKRQPAVIIASAAAGNVRRTSSGSVITSDASPRARSPTASV